MLTCALLLSVWSCGKAVDDNPLVTGAKVRLNLLPRGTGDDADVGRDLVTFL